MKSQKRNTFHGNELPLMSLLICQLPNSFPSRPSDCCPGCSAAQLLLWLVGCPRSQLLPQGSGGSRGAGNLPIPLPANWLVPCQGRLPGKPVLFLSNFLMDSCRIHMSCLITARWRSRIPLGTKPNKLRCFCGVQNCSSHVCLMHVAPSTHFQGVQR